ncbi:flagellar biosynthetic protein FliR [Acetobacteraceae bacterium KSS8]|uniref:Flagellar biosynthetic protein FliR n=1 Tax=Endosaccharibacter trunci TaxID=2812733 RepID=A0ABT1W9G4_9PROT|nr:flagellar biosynthetic protein FliR [Acetobacteraceae bacterium KSS8]
MSAETELLASLPNWAFGFALVLARVGACFSILPGLGEADTPTVIKAGIAVGVSGLILPAALPLLPGADLGPMRVLAVIAGEVGCGLLLGWLARLLVMALPIAGQVVAVQIGLSSVLNPDPALGSQTSGTSRLLALAGPLLILSTGLYAMPIEALVGSYHLFPPGRMLPGGDMAQTVAQATSGCFALAMRLAAPLLIAGLIWQCMLGLLARLVPSLQVYSMSMPGQVLGGLLVFGLLLKRILDAWIGAASAGFSVLPGL